MRVGIILPTFRDRADDALAAAELAAHCGLDGVFAYDHLWPIGRPDRPSLAPFPVLAAVATRVERVALAPLVARVGLVSPATLICQFATLELIAPGRVIAPLGTGDALSADENRAYGLPVESAEARRALLEEVARGLAPSMPVWVGAGAAKTNELARRLGATLNLWSAGPADVTHHLRDGPVSWSGNGGVDVEAQLDELAAAGASWAVLSPSSDIERLGRWRRSRAGEK
jgi:alkanesulfonate monooxygenase SsuD/methylene tetrahydromethanopterin reductase-like flavin-dependent oxidoreductase (luciferase family)